MFCHKYGKIPRHTRQNAITAGDLECILTNVTVNGVNSNIAGLSPGGAKKKNFKVMEDLQSWENGGGFPGMGMPGNMNNLMKQAQKMQRQMEENQKALEEKEFTATAGGGAVEVTISGKREVTKVKLDEEVVDPDDIEMLEDLIVAATNEALRKVEEESTAVMSKLTGGLGGLGGGLPF